MDGKQGMARAPHSMQVASRDNETVGGYRVERYTAKQARSKAVKIALGTLLVALASIVLPGIHFVSVPLGILAAPFIGAYFYRSLNGAPKSMTGDFVCPDCRAPNQVSAQRVSVCYETRCVRCQHEIRLTPL